MASSFEIKSTRPSVGETIVTIVRDHIDYRKQIFKLAGSDLRRTYRASALGWSWAIIKPLVTIFVYWFAFAIGLRRSANPAKWICVDVNPNDVRVESVGDLVLLIMADDSEKYSEAFYALAE